MMSSLLSAMGDGPPAETYAEHPCAVAGEQGGVNCSRAGSAWMRGLVAPVLEHLCATDPSGTALYVDCRAVQVEVVRGLLAPALEQPCLMRNGTAVYIDCPRMTRSIVVDVVNPILDGAVAHVVSQYAMLALAVLLASSFVLACCIRTAFCVVPLRSRRLG